VRTRLALVIAIALWCAPTGAQSWVSFSEIMSAYDAGNYDVIANTLRTPADLRTFMSQLPKVVLNPSAEDPHRAVFWLEVAIAAAALSPGSDVMQVLSIGRIYARDTSGGRPLESFERLWHQAALALLQRIKRPDLQQAYLDSLELRYFVKFKTVPADRPFGRFTLDRAIATEQSCWLAQFPLRLETRSGVTTTVMVGTPRLTAAASVKDAAGLPTACRTAVTEFDRAAAFADVADEAEIRGAVARFKLGRFEDALIALARTKSDGADVVRDYWGALMEARTLQQLKRLPDAARAYRGAWATWPEARAPGTGLALVLFDLNRRDEAVAVSEAVYALPVASIDPWWAYVTADARFIHRWRDALREMAK